jgi:O-antigen/teichoic acid export membrane protein
MQHYKKITKEIGIVYWLQILEFGLMFFLFMALTRSLSKYDFGVYSLLNAIVVFLIVFLPLAIQNFVVKDLAGRNQAVQKKRFSQIFSFSLILTAGGTIILTALAYFILSYLKYGALFFSFLLVAISSAFIVVIVILAHYGYAKKEVSKMTFLEILAKSAWAVPVICLAYFIPLNIENTFLAKIIFTFFVMAFALVYFKKRGLTFISKLDRVYIKEALLYSIPVALTFIPLWIIGAIDKYFLGFFHSAEIVGEYSYIYSLLNFVLLFSVSSIIMTTYPYIVESYNKGLKDRTNTLINASLKYTVILLLPMLTGFFLMGKEITTLISGTKYLHSLPLIPWLIIFPLADGTCAVFRRTLMAVNETKLIAWVYFEAMIVNVITNFVLIPKYGMYGAGLSTSITFTYLWLRFYFVTKKYIRLDYKYLKIGKVAISTAIMAASIAFIRPENIIMKILTIIFGAVVYFASLYLTKAWVREELKLILSFFPFFIRKNSYLNSFIERPNK